ncbi:MAG: PLP-dependent transferase, partial [Chloroflexota bacterium]
MSKSNRRGRDFGFTTRAVHTGERPPAPEFRPVVTPIYPGSTYTYDDIEVMDAALAGDETKYVYTRYGNPTTTALEQALANLEGAPTAIAFSSGMAAIHAAIMTSVKPGDTILTTADLYGHTFATIST